MEVARAAHQVHAAIGMTLEYPLHRFTSRLHAWRGEYGDTIWKQFIGNGIAGMDPDQLFYLISSGSEVGVQF